MGLLGRLALVAAAGLVGAAPAHGAYASARLSVVNSQKALGGGGSLTLSFAQHVGDDTTARIVAYVPRGYSATFVRRAGEVLGSGRATLDSGDQRSIVQGVLRAASPAQYRAHADACSGAGSGLDAVYVLDLADGVRSVLALPVLVRLAPSGAEAAFSSASFTVCFPPPGPPLLADPPPRVLSLSLTFRSFFTNPGRAGAYRWRSVWTPYRDGVRAADAAVEAQALDSLPAQLTLVTGRFDRAVRKLFVGGTLLESRRPVPGGSVQLLAGRTPAVRRIAVTRTNANGNYGGRLGLRPGTWYLQARATVRARTHGGCTVRTFAGIRCVRTTTAGYTLTSRAVRATIPPR